MPGRTTGKARKKSDMVRGSLNVSCKMLWIQFHDGIFKKLIFWKNDWFWRKK